MKKTIVTLLAASLLAGGAVVITNDLASAPVQAATVTKDGFKMAPLLDAQVVVNNTKGAQVYSDIAMTKPIQGKVLALASRWIATDAVTTDTGYRRGFRLGGDQYVKLADANYYTVKERFNGVYTVSVLNHPTWGTAVYNSQFKPIRILPAQSKWRVYGSYFLHGKTYFDLGGQQYISKEYGAMEVLGN